MLSHGWEWQEQIQVLKYALPFSSFNGKDYASQMDAANFPTHSGLPWSGLSFPCCHPATSVHFFPTSLIKTPSSEFHATCHPLLTPDGAPDFTGPFALASSFSQLLWSDWAAQTSMMMPSLTLQPQSLMFQRLSLPMTFYLFCSCSSLLWPCSRLYDHSESCFLWNLKSLTQKPSSQMSACLSLMPLLLLVHLTHWQLYVLSVSHSCLLFVSSLEPVVDHCSTVRSGLSII